MIRRGRHILRENCTKEITFNQKIELFVKSVMTVIKKIKQDFRANKGLGCHYDASALSHRQEEINHKSHYLFFVNTFFFLTEDESVESNTWA